MVHSYKPSTPI